MGLFFVGENLFLLFERCFERKERELVFHIFETFGLRLKPDKPDDRYRDNGDADARQRAQKIYCGRPARLRIVRL